MICFALYYVRMNRHVKFQDKNMAYEISRTIGPNVNPENVKYKDVYAIKELNIGQLGKYDTLEDIKLCKNLVRISVNGGGDKWNSLETNDDVLIVTNKKAETFSQSMSKGKLVGIEGKLRLDEYTNENGEKRSMIKVRVDNFSFIPSNKRKETNNTFSSKDFFTEEIFDNEISESEIPF